VAVVGITSIKLCLLGPEVGLINLLAIGLVVRFGIIVGNGNAQLITCS